jgi:hypothetical protein
MAETAELELELEVMIVGFAGTVIVCVGEELALSE